MVKSANWQIINFSLIKTRSGLVVAAAATATATAFFFFFFFFLLLEIMVVLFIWYLQEFKSLIEKAIVVFFLPKLEVYM